MGEVDATGDGRPTAPEPAADASAPPGDDDGDDRDPGDPGDLGDLGDLGRMQRARAFADRVRARAEGAYADALERRKSSSAIDTAFRAVERDVRSGGAVLAGALAFRLFVFMVPWVFTLVVVLGVGADAANQSPNKMAGRFGITGLVARSVSDAANLSGWARLAALVAGLFALLWAARSLVKVLRTTHALIWGVAPRNRPPVNRGAAALVALVMVATALVSAVGYVKHDSFVFGVVLLGAFTLVPFVMWWWASTTFPRAEESTWKDLWPGAAVLALGMQVLHVFTLVWISRAVETKTERYGAIGVSLALLLWAYVLGRIMILGIVVNQALWSRAHDQAGADASVP